MTEENREGRQSNWLADVLTTVTTLDVPDTNRSVGWLVFAWTSSRIYVTLNSTVDCAVHGCREGAEGGSDVNRNFCERYRCLT